MPVKLLAPLLPTRVKPVLTAAALMLMAVVSVLTAWAAVPVPMTTRSMPANDVPSVKVPVALAV